MNWETFSAFEKIRRHLSKGPNCCGVCGSHDLEQEPNIVEDRRYACQDCGMITVASVGGEWVTRPPS